MGDHQGRYFILGREDIQRLVSGEFARPKGGEHGRKDGARHCRRSGPGASGQRA